MTTFDVSTESPATIAADVIVLPIFEGPEAGPGVEAVSDALDADLLGALGDHRVRGRVGETFGIPSLGRVRATSIVLVGVGPRANAGPAEVRRAAMKAARAGAKFGSLASTLAQVGPSEESARALAEGLVLGSYRFDRYKKATSDGPRDRAELRRAWAIVDAGSDARALKEALRRGRVYGEASNFARDLVNTPSIDATPEFLASHARRIAADAGLKVRIWTKRELERGGFGGILGVGSGSINEPRLIELEYRGDGTSTPIAISGKGVTFDSGGLSIKPADSMEWMKADMGGAAAALATMWAIGQLRPRVNVIAAIPSSENMPGGSAIRPGDVLHHRGGRTSEVLNTDAEGRLILADALAYLTEKKPRVIIESATLTGAAMVALGQEIWALFSNDDALAGEILDAGRDEGEPGWRMPLWADYHKNIESTIADVKNTGPRWGGAINAGLFLKEFVGDVPWAHLDVAGTAFVEHANEYWPRGGTGSPARTLIRYIERQAGDGAAPARRPRAMKAATRRATSNGRSAARGRSGRASARS